MIDRPRKNSILEHRHRAHCTCMYTLHCTSSVYAYILHFSFLLFSRSSLSFSLSLSLSLSSLSLSLSLSLFLFSVRFFSLIALSLLSSHRVEHPLNPLGIVLHHFPRFLSTICLYLSYSILFSFSVSISRAFLAPFRRSALLRQCTFCTGLTPLSWEVKISAATGLFSIRIFGNSRLHD